MPKPTLTTSTVNTHVHEVSARTPDYLDILTVLLPLLTFAAGYYLNNLVEDRKERKRLRQVEEYFLTLAAALVTAVDVQSAGVQDAIGRIQAMADDNLATGLVPELRTARIKAIPDLDLYKIFVANRPDIKANTEYLISMSSALDFIDEVKTRIEGINEDMIKTTSDYISEYNDDISTLTREVQKVDKLGIDPRSGQIIKNTEFQRLSLIYSQLIRAYENKPMGRDITSGYKNFILPLFQATRSIQSNIYTFDTLYVITKLNGDYKNFVDNKELAISMLGDVAMNLINTSNTIQEIIKHFRKNPQKF